MATVLIVDDEPSIRLFLSGLVERLGHAPVEAGNGVDALEVFKKSSIDLAIVDVHMPEMDGLRFLEEAKKIDRQINPKRVVNSKHGVLQKTMKDFLDIFPIQKRSLLMPPQTRFKLKLPAVLLFLKITNQQNSVRPTKKS